MIVGWILAALGGAGLMYLLDPVTGRRRRALVRDKVTKYRNDLMETREGVQKQIADRAQGIAAETRSRLRHEPVDDETLMARVRSEMGRVISHPGAVSVNAHQGRVTLWGNILASEIDTLLKVVRRVPGVQEVENQLHTYEQSTYVPDLHSSTRSSSEGSM